MKSIQGQNETTPNRLMQVCLLGLILLLTYLGVRLIFAIIAPQALWVAPSPQNASVINANPVAPKPLNITYDPFHRAAVVSPAQPIIEQEDAPETSLNLVLTGLRAGESGSAMLKTSNGKQSLFFIGDEVVSGVTLKAVYPNYILITHNGATERLTFIKDETALSVVRPASTPEADLSQLTDQQRQTLETATNSLANMTVNDFLAAISLTPVRDEGRVQGFRVASNRSDFNLADMGLAPGDVIYMIGEEDLRQGRPEFDIIMQSVIQQGNMTIRLLRNGQDMSVKVDL